MPHFEVKQPTEFNLTSYSGMALIGQSCQAAQAAVDARLSVSQSMLTSALLKSEAGC
jgi:hypothetical protein